MSLLRRKPEENAAKVRINCVIRGEGARVLMELKRKGIVSSNREAVVAGLLALYNDIVQRSLREARLRTLRGDDDEA